MKNLSLFLILSLSMSCQPKEKTDAASAAPPQIKVLIIDGENNHGVWPKTTAMMKDFLEETGLFTVVVNRTAYTWSGPHYDQSIGIEPITKLLDMYPMEGVSGTSSVEEPQADPDFAPDFDAYDLVISNMGWKASDWSPAVKDNFETYMQNGGGLVVVHAANNSWGNWPAYNKMIGLGGWGGRSQETGPYVYYDTDGKLIHDTGAGDCGSHGPQQEFVITTRAPNHPIMKGLPTAWMHAKDELYDRLRGPAEGMTVLATAFSDVEKNGPPWNKDVKGSGRHEPMLMAVDYGQGRIFQTALGHMDYSMECVGFMTTFLRGAEWAGTGSVTQSVPGDFPGVDKVSVRTWKF